MTVKEYCNSCQNKGSHKCKSCCVKEFDGVLQGKPTKYIEKPQTNADRIRAMSDEELADNWMKDVVVCHRCAYVEECECDEYVTVEKCKEGLLEWLKQPAEEVTGE